MTTPFKSIVILGAGAMGASFASKFHEMDPSCVAFVASGERYQRLKAEGLTVNGHHYAIPVKSPDEPSSPADLVIVALKQHQLAAALPDLKHHVGDQTVFISVMNGLDSEAIIGKAYGRDKVLYAISVGIDAQRSGSVINFSKIGKLFFGEASNTVISDRVRGIQALLAHADIPYETPEDMIRIMWWKFMINVGVNQASAVLNAPYGIFQTNENAQAIMESAMREVITVARASNVNLVESDIADWYKFLNTLHPEGKTSMLQDVQAGRKTEVDIFAGKVVALGEHYGTPTPVNRVLFHAIRALEDMARLPAS